MISAAARCKHPAQVQLTLPVLRVVDDQIELIGAVDELLLQDDFPLEIEQIHAPLLASVETQVFRDLQQRHLTGSVGTCCPLHF